MNAQLEELLSILQQETELHEKLLQLLQEEAEGFGNLSASKMLKLQSLKLHAKNTKAATARSSSHNLRFHSTPIL